MKDIFEKVDEAANDEQWAEVKVLIRKALKQYPDDFYLYTKLSSAFYEEQNYKKAFELIKKAYRLEPKEPLVMWHYAGTLAAIGRKTEAVAIFKSITKKGVKRIAYSDTIEGIRWAKSLINDCFYSIGLCYKDMGKKSLAKKWLNKHIESRCRGIPSLYSLKDVQKQIRAIEKI